ncbi:SpoIID/LytB domain-containing protein [Kitasatospora sp. NPDC052896]|uniref:SpoIID/LytB domain-containing protein n=1 Tax=Kitasatospora sp. NPDC052896 TaxID=3364061 RepID=UPI0037CC20C8
MRGLRLTAVAVSAMATICGAAVAPAAAAPVPQDPPATSIALSGKVTDARAERVSDGVISAPASAPAVPGARIEVDGTLVGWTDRTGGFAFDYPDPTGKAVSVTVAAPGFGTYQLNGVTPAHTGDSLTVQLTGKAQSASDQATPVKAPLNRARAVAPAATGGSGCGGYSSNSTPPSSIQVLEYSQHTNTGAPVDGTQTGVFTVPFQTYVDDVLPNEWIPSWQPASLEAGAMAVKTYAWYWVNNWGNGSYNGTCYNVDDSTNYQRYIPNQDNSATDAAVAATWNSVMTKNGSIFEASFQATLTGNQNEACGSGESNYPNTLSQWGSQNCAVAGDSWQSILNTYYPGISIGGSALSTLSIDAAGDRVAFVDTNGNVANDWTVNGSWQGPAGIGGQARSDSPVVLDAKADHAFFVGTDGSVANDWVTNGVWRGGSPIGGYARPGSPITTNAAGTLVAFVDTNGNVAYDWYASGGWHGPSTVGGQARSDSPLAFDSNGDHLFFIDTNGNVANDWTSNGAWQGPAPIGGQARAGSGLTTNAAGTLVAFADANGNVVNDWVTNGAWNGPWGIGGQARADSPLAFDSNGDHLFFIDTNGNVANDWTTNGSWQGPAPIGGQARAGSALTTNAAGNLVDFLDANGNVVNDWVTNGAWNGPWGIGGTSR